MAPNTQIFKNWKFLVFVGVVLTLFIIFIIGGNPSNTNSNNTNSVQDKFTVPQSQANTQSYQDIYKNQNMVKDANLDEFNNLDNKQMLNNDCTLVDPNTPVPKNANINNSNTNSKRKKVKSKVTEEDNEQANKNAEAELAYLQYKQDSIRMAKMRGSTWSRQTNTQTPQGKSSFTAVSFGDNEIVSSTGICKIRTTQEFMLNDIKIPKNTIFTCIVSRSSEFINITLREAIINNQVIECNFEVYTNGVKGIYHKSEVVRSNFKQSVGSAVSGLASYASTNRVGQALGAAAKDAAQRSASQTIQQENVTIQDGFKMLFVKQE